MLRFWTDIQCRFESCPDYKQQQERLMNHYYQNIHGWFDYEEIIKLAIDKGEDGAKFVKFLDI